MIHAAIRRGRKLLLHTPYVLPKNASENERLDAQHHLMQLVLGASHLAPLSRPQAMLDVGCGTGLWCREMGAAYPRARVLGIDYALDPLRALESRLPARERPANVSWRQVNALEPWPLIDGSFDYVHLRFCATWIPRQQWLHVLAEVYRVLKPGGLVELTEGTMPKSAGPAYTALGKTMVGLLRQRGLSAVVAEHLTDLLGAAGFVEVEGRTFLTGQTEEEQRVLFETTLQGFKALAPLLSKSLKQPDYDTYLANVGVVERVKPYVTRRDYAAWGRKPS